MAPNWSGKHEVDTWIWHQIGLELGDVNVESTIKAQRGRKRRNNLSKQTVKISVCRTLNVKISATNVIQGLVVIHDSHIRVLEQGMYAKDCVVGLNHGSGHLRARPDCEGQLALLTIVHRKALKHQTSQTTACTSTTSVVDHETLQAGAIVSELADAVKHEIDNLFANGVMATCKVVGCILLACDKLLWVEELTVCSSPHLIHNCGFEINHHATGDMLACASL